MTYRGPGRCPQRIDNHPPPRRAVAAAVMPGLLASLTLIAALPSAGQSPVPAPYVLTDPKAVQTAEALFQDVQAIARQVTPCVERGAGTPAVCICRFPAELRRVQDSARAARARHPEWQNRVVNWTDPASRQSRAISLDSVLRQSQAKCPPG